jgi:zinc transporter
MQDGFKYSLLLQGEEPARHLTEPEIAQWRPEQGILWLHLNYRNPKARQWLQHSDLPEVEIDALLARDIRPRAETTADGILLALRGVNLNPDADPEDMVAVRLYADQHKIITTSDRELLSLRDVAELIMKEKGPRTCGDFIVTLCDRLTNRKVEFIDKIEDQLAAMEEQVLLGKTRELRSQIAELRRQTVAVRRYLAPQREAYSRLLANASPLFSQGDRLRLREINDKLIRTIEDLDAVRDRANVTHEELLSQQSEQLNKRLYFLSLVSAIFLPLGFLTGLLGVNIGGIPGADTPWAFGVFCLGLVLLVAMQMWFFYRSKWL